MSTMILDLTNIEEVTLMKINKRIFDFIADNKTTPGSIILTTKQMSYITDFFVDGENIGWQHYRGIPVILMKQ